MNKNKKSNFFINYLFNDVQNKPQTFRVGFIIIFITVFISLFLLDFNQIGSFIFLRLAEKNIGDTDLTYIIDFNNKNKIIQPNEILINQKEIREKMKKLNEIGGISGRWIIPSRISNIGGKVDYNIFLIVTDTWYEKKNGFGRNFDYEPLKDNEIIMNEEIFYILNLKDKKEKLVNIEINLFKTLSQFGIKEDELKKTVDLLLDKNLEDFTKTLKNILSNNFRADLVFNLLERFGVKLNNIQKLGINFFWSSINNQQKEIIYNFISNDNIKKLAWFLIKNLSNIKEKFKVKKVYESSEGYFQNYGNNIVLDLSYLKKIFSKLIFNAVENFFKDYGRNFDINIVNQIKEFINRFLNYLLNDQNNSIFNYFPIVNVIFKNKEIVYHDLNNFDKKVISISNLMAEDYSKDFKILTPLKSALKAFSIITIIINVLIKSIIIFLMSISLCIIYSITLFYVGESNYEFGMLRSLGFNLRNLRIINSLKTFFFSIPSTIFGLGFSIILIQFLISYINNAFHLRFIYFFNYTYFFISLFIGIYFTYLISFVAIRKSLKKNLRSALEVWERDFSNYIINVIKLSKLGVNKTQLYLSILFIFYGVTFIYLIPKFINEKLFEYFLLLIMFILYLILIGLNLLFITLLPYLQKLLVFIFMYPFKRIRCCLLIVNKNIQSNLKNNSKAFLIVSLIVSFIIFNEASIKMQTNLIINFTSIQFPSDLYYRTTLKYLNTTNLDIQFKKIEKEFPGLIKSYSYLGINLNDNPFVQSLEISPSIGFPKDEFNIYPIDKNYLNSINNKFFIPNEYSKNNYDLNNFFKEEKEIEIKEDKNNILSIKNERVFKQKIIKYIIPSGSYDFNSIKSNSFIYMYLYPNYLENMTFKGYAYLSADLFPGFQFSKYQSKMNIPIFKNYIISNDDYLYIQKKLVNKFLAENEKINDPKIKELLEKFDYKKDIPSKTLNIKFARTPTKLELGFVQKLVEIEIDNLGLIFFNTIKTTNDIRGSLFYFDLFNVIILIITVFLCFFILFIFFLKKLKENIWEFSVMRAIGINKSQGILIFLVENLSTLLTGLIIGLIIGILISFLSILQFNVWIEIPFEIVFPYTSFFMIVFLIIIMGVLITLLGLKKIINKPLSNLLKGFIN